VSEAVLENEDGALACCGGVGLMTSEDEDGCFCGELLEEVLEEEEDTRVIEDKDDDEEYGGINNPGE
jgi:hypothetical protein